MILLKTAFQVDENGFIKDSFVVSLDDNGFLEYFLDEFGNQVSNDLEKIITIDLPQPCFMIKPMWNGTEWVEGETHEEKEERIALEKINALQPSPAEIEDSELEIKVITILREMEVI